MGATRFVCASVVAGVIALAPSTAAAQESPQALRQEIDQLRKDFETLKQQYGDRLTALETKLAAAEGGSPPGAAPPPAAAAAPPAQAAPPVAQVPAGAEGAGGPTGALPTYGSAANSSKIFNPDMAVIGDFLGAAGKNDVNPSPAMEMHESELSLQAVVDPYARADFFISFGEEGVDLEEGFLTLTELPGGLLTKVGKMRAAFGKVNTLHNHILTWTDRPLVTQNLVGGEDGIDDAGISVARLIPNPWIFLEATGQVFRGDSGDLYKSNKRSDLSYVGHLRGYQDITESSNLDLGFSYSRGHNNSATTAPTGTPESMDDFTTQLYGIDATFRWKPLQRSLYHSFVGRTEWIWSRRDQPTGLQSTDGFYVSGDYQLGRRWFAGARFDRSGHATDASLVDTGGSFVITYWPSEFSQVRAQYRRTNYETAPSIVSSANELLFQFQFSIGAHGAHPF
ncbi:MAG TPA: hypothetical protein VFI56_03090 [Vicinamibacterales bacterium]|jgi:hypothetical protein|nr:hypothetical protein [Vicinamibacterales bacterium]